MRIMKGMSNLGIKPITIDVATEDRRKTATSSKGNQTKWCKDGLWVKADFMGYEGIAECVASVVAHNTNIGDFAPVVDYFMCNGTAEGRDYVGCYSRNFLGEGESCITVQRLMTFKYGKGLDRRLLKMATKDRVKTVVDFMVEETGINNFGEWITCLLEFDSLILNEDRHLHNIAVIRKADGTYKLMPLFDNGAAFCSDTTKDYPMTTPLHVCIRNVKAKPFNVKFDAQINACRELYCRQLEVNVTAQDITFGLLDGFVDYPQAVKARVINILREQLRNITV